MASRERSALRRSSTGFALRTRESPKPEHEMELARRRAKEGK